MDNESKLLLEEKEKNLEKIRSRRMMLMAYKSYRLPEVIDLYRQMTKIPLFFKCGRLVKFEKKFHDLIAEHENLKDQIEDLLEQEIKAFKEWNNLIRQVLLKE